MKLLAILAYLVLFCTLSEAVRASDMSTELSNSSESLFSFEPVTIYTILGVLLLVLAAWLLWRNFKTSTDSMSDTVVTLTGVAGIILAGASFFLSVNYGYSMGNGKLMLSIVFSLTLGAISIAEFLSSYWLERWLVKRNAFMFLISLIIMGTGALVSILAGQANIANRIDEAKSQRVMESEQYKSAVTQRDNANQKAESLAISDSEYQSALDQAKRSKGIGERIIDQANSSYSDCSSWPNSLCAPKGNYRTKTNELNAKLSNHFNQIQNARLIVSKYNDYQAAKQYSNELLEKPLPNATQTELPHVKWLAVISGAPADLIEARLYLFLAVITELFGMLLLYFYGQESRKGTSHSYSQLKPAKVSPLPPEFAKLENGGFVHGNGLVELHDGELVIPKKHVALVQELLASRIDGFSRNQTTTHTTPSQQQAQTVNTTQDVNITTEANDKTSRNTTTRNKEGGKSYDPIACANCGTVFTPRQWNQKFCSNDCRAKGHGFKDEEHVKRTVGKKRALSTQN